MGKGMEVGLEMDGDGDGDEDGDSEPIWHPPPEPLRQKMPRPIPPSPKRAAINIPSRISCIRNSKTGVLFFGSLSPTLVHWIILYRRVGGGWWEGFLKRNPA